MTPTVSVILPSFNRLEFLRVAVESVFAQTFADWELIVVDDGSGETTRTYLAELSQRPRVSVLCLEHTGVPAIVRNAALRAARGSYVAFLDSDDLWVPHKLERQLAALKQQPAYRWSYTACGRIDETGAELNVPGGRPWRPYGGAIFRQLLTFDAAVGVPTVMVERSLLTEVGGFDEQQVMYEDYDLWMRLASRSDVLLVDERLTYIRSHLQHFTLSNDRVRSACRCRLVAKARAHTTDPQVHRLMDDLYARYSLDLASACADTDRLAGLRAWLGAGLRPWRDARLWLEWNRTLLKLLTPRPLRAWGRRIRARAA